MAYYDAAVAAAYIRQPMHLAAELFDPAVAPPVAVYNALPGPKKLFVLTAGHFEHAEARRRTGSCYRSYEVFSAAMNREYHRWYSQRLGRDMDLRICDSAVSLYSNLCTCNRKQEL